MAKGYWIGRVDVKDEAAYQNYIAANAVPFEKFGARFLIRGGKFETMEGGARTRNVVIEFPSYEDALACYNSPEYKYAMSFREAPVAEADIIVIDLKSTPMIAHRANHAEDLWQMLFVQMIMADDRAIRATYIGGKRLYERDA